MQVHFTNSSAVLPLQWGKHFGQLQPGQSDYTATVDGGHRAAWDPRVVMGAQGHHSKPHFLQNFGSGSSLSFPGSKPCPPNGKRQKNIVSCPLHGQRRAGQ